MMSLYSVVVTQLNSFASEADIVIGDVYFTLFTLRSLCIGLTTNSRTSLLDFIRRRVSVGELTVIQRLHLFYFDSWAEIFLP